MRIRLSESSSMTPLEKMRAFNDGTRKENLRACKIDKLIMYYKIALEHDLTRAAMYIEVEFETRDLPEYIVPRACLKAPRTRCFSEEVARAVIDAKGDLEVILNCARRAYSYGTVIVAAYILSIVLNETALEKALRTFIVTIGTYDHKMKAFIEDCLENSEIVDHFEKIAKKMEDYKAWA